MLTLRTVPFKISVVQNSPDVYLVRVAILTLAGVFLRWRRMYLFKGPLEAQENGL